MIIYKEESYRITGVIFEVYKEKGCGFLEEVYQECLELECKAQGIPFERQKGLKLSYKGQELKKKYIADLVCFGKIIIEIKAVQKLANPHRAQLQNYLKATGYKLGLLVNFGHYPKVEIERIAN